ncbi:uncharacterized protein LOC126622778 [Malus sylvestris]|uniref:uncharacterized protein LOC126622778 n=1 Tax=Malus sylvestris TaxID=3752 RepID=UPI0021AC9FEA|nr:uncharacterized protein LOC126622778 [Malus sylvestris]
MDRCVFGVSMTSKLRNSELDYESNIVIKSKLARPGRVPVTTCAWDRDGKRIAGGIGHGSIQVLAGISYFNNHSSELAHKWKYGTLSLDGGSRPDIHVQNSHSDDITGLKFSVDGRILLSRNLDGTLKVWDLRQMKDPLKAFEDLPNNYACFETRGLTPCNFSETLPSFWSPPRSKLRQVGGFWSTCSIRQGGGGHEAEALGRVVAVAAAHTPDQPSRKREREKALKDPLKAHKPELPMMGPGFGGRVGASKGSLLTQYLMKTWMDEDPREAILKYADVAAKEPKYIAPVYAQTQPEAVFAKSGSEDEEK